MGLIDCCSDGPMYLLVPVVGSCFVHGIQLPTTSSGPYLYEVDAASSPSVFAVAAHLAKKYDNFLIYSRSQSS